MEKSILLVLVGNRKESAVRVQQILTEMGCFIKTRLGIHEEAPEACANTGLIILELLGEEEDKNKVVKKLERVEHINVKLVNLCI